MCRCSYLKYPCSLNIIDSRRASIAALVSAKFAVDGDICRTKAWYIDSRKVSV